MDTHQQIVMEQEESDIKKLIDAYETSCLSVGKRVYALFDEPRISCDKKAFYVKLVGLHLDNVDVSNPSFSFTLDQIAYNWYQDIEEADNHVPQYCLVVVDHSHKHIAMVGMHVSHLGDQKDPTMSNTISHVFVDPQYRNKAIGFQLMSLAEIFLGMVSGTDRISLMVVSREVVGFFIRCGYVEITTKLPPELISIPMRKAIPLGEYNKRNDIMTLASVRCKRSKASWLIATDDRLTEEERSSPKNYVSESMMTMYRDLRLSKKKSDAPSIPRALR
jgi:GNAT superfamily N-acetyltransferase